MIKKFKEIYSREQFRPTFLSFFLNPYYFIRRGLLEGIKSNAKEMRGKLLDFGCGNKPYKDLFIVDQYIGLDISKSGHDHKDEDIDVYYDGKRIPFNDKYFDCLFSSEVFEHIFNLEEIIKEINRVLKLNAKILLTIPFVWDEHEKPFDFARYTSFGIKFLLEKNGFRVIDIKKSTNNIETIFQMWNTYLYQRIFPENKYIKFLLTLFIITFFNISGLIISKILPKDYNFYLNNIVIAVKISDSSGY